MAVGHRVVHGGPDYDRPVLVDHGLVARLERYIALAPLHQPHNLAPIKSLRRPVTLRQIENDPRLKRIQLVRQSRLSVMPMAATDFRAIVLMGR